MSTRLRRAFEGPILAALIGAAVAVGTLQVGDGADAPILSSGSGVPAGTGSRGSLYLRTDTADVYQNTDGATTWRQLGLETAASADYFFGTAYDGDCDFDGVTTPVCDAALSGSTYTLIRPLYADDVAIAEGVRVNTGGYQVFATGAISGLGVISRNGSNASGSSGGAVTPNGTLPGGYAGGNGNTGTGGGGSATLTAPRWCVTNTAANGGGWPSTPDGTDGTSCRGGGGGATAFGSGANGGQMTAGNGSEALLPHVLFLGARRDLTVYGAHSSGGAGGGISGGASGGGGGGAPGWVVVAARDCDSGTWSVESIGGDGAPGTGTDAAGGGGAAGGTAIVFCGAGTAPAVLVENGCGGAGNGTGGDGGDGGAGHRAVYSPSTGWVHGSDVAACP